MYVAVKGGEAAIDNAHRLLADGAAAIAAVPALRLDQIDEQLGARRRPRDGRRLALRPRAGRAGDQAGARRPDRGDLPAARLSHHPAALRLHRSRSTPARMRIRAPHLGDLQGPAGRAGARPDLRLHPPPARFRAGRRRRARRAAPTAPSADGRADAARRRHPRPRGPDRAATAATPTAEPATSRASRWPSRPTATAAAGLARGDEGFLLALGYSTQRGYGGTHPFVGEIRIGEVAVEIDARGARLRRSRSATIARHRMPDGQPVHGLGRRAAAVHPRLRPGLRPCRAQGDGDGAGRPRAARRANSARTSPRRRRTRSSCCPTPTTSRRPASSST